jgi:hypothetical protein
LLGGHEAEIHQHVHQIIVFFSHNLVGFTARTFVKSSIQTIGETRDVNATSLDSRADASKRRVI